MFISGYHFLSLLNGIYTIRSNLKLRNPFIDHCLAEIVLSLFSITLKTVSACCFGLTGFTWLVAAFQRPRATSFRNQDDCFNVDCNEFSEDFDFEKNLALFDKQALYDEVYSGSDGEVR